MFYNVQEYHKPTDIDSALSLLGQGTLPLYGTFSEIPPQERGQYEAVVDLSGLELDTIEEIGQTLHIGAMATLQQVVDTLGDAAGGLLADTAQRSAGWHMRNMLTVGALLANGPAQVPFSVALTALGAQAIVASADEPQPWSSLLLNIPQGQIVTYVQVEIPEGKAGASYRQVGRTPKDLPIVSAAAILTPSSGDTFSGRIAIGGLLDGQLQYTDISTTEADAGTFDIHDTLAAADSTLSDSLGSADYRREMARILCQRAVSSAVHQLR